jgi:hypothetical protein
MSKATNVNLRLDGELRRQVQECAEASERSLQGEIVWRLRNSLKQAGGGGSSGDQQVAENSERRRAARMPNSR